MKQQKHLSLFLTDSQANDNKPLPNPSSATKRLNMNNQLNQETATSYPAYSPSLASSKFDSQQPQAYHSLISEYDNGYGDVNIRSFKSSVIVLIQLPSDQNILR